jgi:type II secretory pathway pseudopilin PulG
MRLNSKRAITLIELVISIALVGMVMLGVLGIYTFSYRQFVNTDKRSKIQNEANLVLSHISKNLLRAIGDAADPPLTVNGFGNSVVICATIDSSPDGIRNLANDFNISYCFNDIGCNNPVAQPFTMFFNANISDPLSIPEIIASHVQFFSAILENNFLNVTISTCWDPTGTPQPCGSIDNPAMNMTSIIKMPSVSAR